MRFNYLITAVLTALTLTACRGGGMSVYNVCDFGAVADSTKDCSAQIQKAIDRCAENGGGTVVFPASKSFMSGPLEMKSNVNLHFEPASRLLANPDESVYTLSAFRENRGEGMMWLHGKDITNFSITGTGTIDGNGVAFMGAELDDSYELKPVTDFDPRPHVLTLINATKVNISDVTIRNSAYWTVHLVGCTDVAINHISLLNNLKIRNGDGIDLDHSRKVRITGCYIESGDDCICLKNRREFEEYGPCRDIVVTNCIMTSRSCAVKIGSENMDSINRVLFNNCIITDSNRGIGIQNRDEGTVSDVTFADMTVDCHLFSDVWWGKSEPIYITSYPRAVGNHKDAGWRFPKGATEGRCGAVSNIRFRNISCTSENGIFIGCDQPGKVNDITLTNIDIDFVKSTAYPGMVYDRRPCVGEGFASGKTYGILAENASGIRVNGFTFDTKEFPAENFGGEFRFVDCTDVKTE